VDPTGEDGSATRGTPDRRIDGTVVAPLRKVTTVNPTAIGAYLGALAGAAIGIALTVATGAVFAAPVAVAVGTAAGAGIGAARSERTGHGLNP
jgi:uncharacterized membrane protein